eukprot:TRINITY_DN20008_c0_g1_i1.p1 TRINITY_DN20008_c0_g1~~TRINITY_DN20008_c0_g1_i1.p1  ORF type:complete len:859 (+),score=196.35 TRINITY_DN20008_c0_g1_i1:66-2579(+)
MLRQRMRPPPLQRSRRGPPAARVLLVAAAVAVLAPLLAALRAAALRPPAPPQPAVAVAGDPGGCDGPYEPLGRGEWARRGPAPGGTPYRVSTALRWHNVRTGPSTAAPVSFRLRDGAVALVSALCDLAAEGAADSTRWAQLRAGERRGWAVLAAGPGAEYLRPVGAAHGPAVLRASPEGGYDCAAEGSGAWHSVSAALVAPAPPGAAEGPAGPAAPGAVCAAAAAAAASAVAAAAGAAGAQEQGEGADAEPPEEPPEWAAWADEGAALRWLGGLRTALPADQLEMLSGAVTGAGSAAHLIVIGLPHCVGRRLSPHGREPPRRRPRRKPSGAVAGGWAAPTPVPLLRSQLRLGRQAEAALRGWRQARREAAEAERRSLGELRAGARRALQLGPAARLEMQAEEAPVSATQRVRWLDSPLDPSVIAGERNWTARRGLRFAGDGSGREHPLGLCTELRNFVVLLDSGGRLLRARGLPVPRSESYDRVGGAAGVGGMEGKWVRGVRTVNATAACGLVAGDHSPDSAYLFEWDFVSDRLAITPLPPATVPSGGLECLGAGEFALLARRDSEVAVEHRGRPRTLSVYDDEPIRVRPPGRIAWRWRRHLPFRLGWLPGCGPGRHEGAVACRDPLGYTQGTALYWSPAANWTLLAAAGLGTVFAVSKRSGAPLWSLGRVGSLRLTAGTGLRRPASAEPRGRLRDGRRLLAVYDGPPPPAALGAETAEAARAVLFAVDPRRGAAEQLWERPAGGGGAGLHQPTGGDFDLLPGGEAAVITEGRLEPPAAAWPVPPDLPPLAGKITTAALDSGRALAELTLGPKVWGADRADPLLPRPGCGSARTTPP